MNSLTYIKKVVAGLFAISLLALVALLTWEPWLKIYYFLLYSTGILFVVDYLVNQRWKGYIFTREKIVFLLMILYYCLPLVRQLWDPIHDFYFRWEMNLYAPFLVFGLAGLASTKLPVRVSWVGWTMLASSILSMVYVLSIAGPPHGDYKEWMETVHHMRINHYTTHMTANVYRNMALVFALFTVNTKDIARWKKGVTLAAMLVVLLELLLSEGRTGQLTFLLLTLTYTIPLVWKKSWKGFTYLLLAIFFVGISLWNNPRIHNMRERPDNRVYVWHVATEMVKERPWFGYGVCTGRHQFIERGMEDKDFMDYYYPTIVPYFVERGLPVDNRYIHPHSIILQSWIEYGVFGVIALCLLLLYPIWKPVRDRSLYVQLLIVAFATQGLFESFAKHYPPMFFAMLLFVMYYAMDASDSANNVSSSELQESLPA